MPEFHTIYGIPEYASQDDYLILSQATGLFPYINQNEQMPVWPSKQYPQDWYDLNGDWLTVSLIQQVDAPAYHIVYDAFYSNPHVGIETLNRQRSRRHTSSSRMTYDNLEEATMDFEFIKTSMKSEWKRQIAQDNSRRRALNERRQPRTLTDIPAPGGEVTPNNAVMPVFYDYQLGRIVDADGNAWSSQFWRMFWEQWQRDSYPVPAITWR